MCATDQRDEHTLSKHAHAQRAKMIDKNTIGPNNSATEDENTESENSDQRNNCLEESENQPQTLSKEEDRKRSIKGIS